MATDLGIPAAALGIKGEIADQVSKMIAPEYDVVHICTTILVAKTELSKLISGDLSVIPSSGFGSNLKRAESERRIPKLVVVGAGFTDEDLEELKAAVGEKGEDVTFIKISREALEKRTGTTVQNPNKEWLINNVREQLMAKMNK